MRQVRGPSFSSVLDYFWRAHREEFTSRTCVLLTVMDERRGKTALVSEIENKQVCEEGGVGVSYRPLVAGSSHSLNFTLESGWNKHLTRMESHSLRRSGG